MKRITGVGLGRVGLWCLYRDSSESFDFFTLFLLVLSNTFLMIFIRSVCGRCTCGRSMSILFSLLTGGVCGRCTCGLRSKRVVFSLSHHLRHDIIGDKLLRISVGLLLQNLDKILDLENGYVKYYGLVTRFTNVMYFRVQYHHQNEMGLK